MTTVYSDRLFGVSIPAAIKAPVRVATTANIDLSGLQAVDGVTVAAGDRVLVKDQSSAVDNGIWVVAVGAWARATDFDGSRDATKGSLINVNEGTANGESVFMLNTDDPVIGTSNMAFTKTASASVAAAADASASAASASASAAATSESNAATSESNAATSAGEASTSAGAAATSEGNAATSAGNAATSEGNAATSAASAAASAAAADGVPISLASTAELLADNNLTYTTEQSGSVTVGQRIAYGPHAGIVAASGASDHDIATSGGVKFYIEPGADGAYNAGAWGVWTAGADVSTVLDTALTAIFAKRIAKMTFPAGRYLLNTRVEAGFPSVGQPVQIIDLDFSGCILEVPETNTTGAIDLTKENNFQHIRVRNVEIQSAAPIGTAGSATNGTGFRVLSNLAPGDPGWGTPAAKEVILENVHVVSKNPGLYGRWNKGIEVKNCWFPELRSCYVDTRHPGTDADTDYETAEGIKILNCFQATLVDCKSVGRWLHNIRVTENADFGYEDFQITGCYGESGKDSLTIGMETGARQSTALKEPGGRISGGHYNGHRYAINIADRRQFTIDGPLLYLTIGTGKHNYPEAAYLKLHDCFDADISIQVPEGGHYVSGSDCTRHVHLDGLTDYIRVHDSQFGANGVAIANSSTGTNNVIEGNSYVSYPAPNNSGPTTRFIDTSKLLRGADVPRAVTPELEFGGANTGMTYSSRDGFVLEAGRQVTFSFQIVLSAKGSSTGDANIDAGLPAPISGSDFAASVSYSSGAGTQAALGGIVSSNGQIHLYHRNATENLNQRITNADFDNATEIRVSGTYIAAEA